MVTEYNETCKLTNLHATEDNRRFVCMRFHCKTPGGVYFPKKYAFILDREAKASIVLKWNSVHTPERVLPQLLLGPIWEFFYFCCCFPQMFHKSTVIKASSWKPIRFFNYVARKFWVYHLAHISSWSQV